MQEIVNCSVLRYEHPNIQHLKACALDIREQQNPLQKKALLLFSYINGGTLYSYVKNGEFEKFLNQKYPNNQKAQKEAMLDFFIQLCDGLEYLHNQNLYHCDLTPRNIMVQISADKQNIKPVIIDYGISVF